MATNQLADIFFLAYEFVIHRSRDNQYYWTYSNIRGNTEPIAISEMYTTKQSCKDSIAKVKDGANSAVVRDTTTSGLLGG
jgi:uncharacterized protein YegP (UPF0339 family)